jgi:hypothetical protein
MKTRYTFNPLATYGAAASKRIAAMPHAVRTLVGFPQERSQFVHVVEDGARLGFSFAAIGQVGKFRASRCVET